VDSAFQGQEALEMVKRSLEAGRPYAMAFMDIRMPPGWDGVQTTMRIWEIHPDLQTVICIAYSDYSWDEITKHLGASENLLILRKPFDNIEALQLACALTRKWSLGQHAKLKVEELDRRVELRTRELWMANQNLQQEVAEHNAAQQSLRRSCCQPKCFN
jgi:CheY-like chemotaxis protein